jgi:hypothetical protein
MKIHRGMMSEARAVSEETKAMGMGRVTTHARGRLDGIAHAAVAVAGALSPLRAGIAVIGRDLDQKTLSADLVNAAVASTKMKMGKTRAHANMTMTTVG